jgi:hypothetical protein
MNCTWIFGSTSSIGEFLYSKIVATEKVIGFSRSYSKFQNNYQIDLSSHQELETYINDLLLDDDNFPTSIVFCQRFRNYTNDFITDYKNSFDLEIIPVIILRNILLSKLKQLGKSHYNISIIWLSSTAAHENHLDIHEAYHLIKSNCSRLVKLFSFTDRNITLRWNSITLGEIVKYPLNTYDNNKIKIFDKISTFTFNNKIAILDDLLNAYNFLSANNSKYISGIDININGGLNNLSLESFLRKF